LLLDPLQARSKAQGLLLYGPSGNGKTMLARYIGYEIENQGIANFIAAKAVDLVSRVVGETELNIAKLFRKARFVCSLSCADVRARACND